MPSPVRAGLTLALLVTSVLSAPAQEEKKPLRRIAFGSCNNQDRPQVIWEALLASKPDLFLFLGDNIYADTTDPFTLRKEYARLAANPGYQKLRKACPVLATWDDHDYGLNDSGAEHPTKAASQEVFLDFFGVPRDSPRRKREGVYHAEVFGPPGKRVQVILLDTRYHRSKLKKAERPVPGRGDYVPNDDPDATILGAAQWKWLEGQLAVPAEVRLLCSSIQVVAEDHGYEKWMNFPRERARLYQLLRSTRASGVIILSGDRHLAELSQADVGLGYPLLDLTSSGMNMANKRWRALEVNRHRVATMDRGNNFGLVLIDWDKEDPIIHLQIRDEDGDVTIGHKVPLSRLQPGKGGKAKEDGPDLSAQARKHVGKEWEVEMTVRATGANRGKTLVFLNSESDFKSERNFTVVLDVKALGTALEAAKIEDPARYYKGKTVKVKGVVSLFKEQPQIVVKKLEQIEVVAK